MSKTAFARVVSIVAHPFTFILLLVLLSLRARGEVAALRVAGIVAAIALLPIALFSWQRYASGRWTTFDASDPSNRPALYMVCFVVLLPLMFYFRYVLRSVELVRGSVVVAVMLAVAAFLNRWIKISGHVAFATLSGVIFARVHLVYALPMLVIVPVLAWSRLELRRHTLREVVAGFVTGLVTGGAAIWAITLRL